MTRMKREMLARAEGFVWLTGRVLDQRRFAYHFGSGSAEGVRRALEAYHAPDGGFAFGLEPDVRGSASQPVTMATALKLLDETGQLDEATAAPLCDWLASVSAPDGGWPINWAQWSPIAASESRPAVTTLALLTLRAYDAPGAS